MESSTNTTSTISTTSTASQFNQIIINNDINPDGMNHNNEAEERPQNTKNENYLFTTKTLFNFLL